MKQVIAYLKEKYSLVFIWLVIPIVTITNFSHHSWVNPESVIDWDVKSYYAYLPAFFIHNDLSLNFIETNPEEYGKWYWPATTPTGGKCIVTSMGLSVLYAPFFLIGHLAAHLGGFNTEGYSEPYAFALHFSALFYLIIGLFFLRKLLLNYFNQLTTFITLLLVFFGTNLFYYTAYSATMSHSYGFALIAVFIYLVNKWHEKQSIRYTILIGLLAGLIALIRPTNILVLLILFFWNVSSFRDLGLRVKFFLRNYRLVILMAVLFFLVWFPQFLYWKSVAGRFLYFSYEGLDSNFYWGNPQIRNTLVSFRKGWWIYTPIMFVASLSIALMYTRFKALFLTVLVFLIANIYVQSSWWCWWFGGSFGHRAFIDSYALMAFPLAVLIAFLLNKGIKGLPFLAILGLLAAYNLFQIKQMRHQTLHYYWMSKKGYFQQFLKVRTTKGYWETIPLPDFDKARRGVYVASNLIERYKPWNNIRISPEEILGEIRNSIEPGPKYERYARKHNISVDSAITIDAWNQYELRWSVDRFVRPLVIEKLTDSLLVDTTFLNSELPNWKQSNPEELREQVQVISESLVSKERF